MEEEAKVKVAAEATDLVRLFQVVLPETVWLVPSKITEPELWVKVPPEWTKLPAMVKLPEGAVKAPLDNVKLPFASSVVLGVVKVPEPAMVKWW